MRRDICGRMSRTASARCRTNTPPYTASRRAQSSRAAVVLAGRHRCRVFDEELRDLVVAYMMLPCQRWHLADYVHAPSD